MSSYVVESATKFKFYALGEAEAKGGGRNGRVHAPHFSQRLYFFQTPAGDSVGGRRD
jgi:hypothetical protein